MAAGRRRRWHARNPYGARGRALAGAWEKGRAAGIVARRAAASPYGEGRGWRPVFRRAWRLGFQSVEDELVLDESSQFGVRSAEEEGEGGA